MVWDMGLSFCANGDALKYPDTDTKNARKDRYGRRCAVHGVRA